MSCFLRAFVLYLYSLEESEQNKHALTEGQIAEPGAGINEALAVLVVGAADACMDGERFHCRDDEQQKAWRPGGIMQHEPDAVEQKNYVQDKVDKKYSCAAVYDNNLALVRISAALGGNAAEVLQQISNAVCVDEVKHSYAKKK